MRKLLLYTTTALGALAISPAANAALLALGPNTTTEGLTYVLESQATANPLVEQFALVITGENSASDTRGGRTGINGFAFNLVSNNPDSPFTGQVVGERINGVTTLGTNGFVYQAGGLNAGGCNLSGNFFCFNNTLIGDSGAAPQPPASPLLNGPIVLGFEVTLLPGGSWSNYTTALKIDWVGSENNYSNVSLSIPVNTTCPDCVINPTAVDAAEPATIGVLGVGVLGMMALTRRRIPYAG